MSASTVAMNDLLDRRLVTADVTTGTNESFTVEDQKIHLADVLSGSENQAWNVPINIDVTTMGLVHKTQVTTRTTDSPFETLDEHNAFDAEKLLASARLLPRPDAAAVSDRLEELLEISVETDDIRVMSAQSLRFFLDFIRHNIRVRTPLIFLLESGSVRAEWRVSPREAIAIQFRPDGNVDFVSISPRLGRPTSTQISSGENISWRKVIDSIQQGSDLGWLWT